MRCQFCGREGFPIGATGYAICPSCVSEIYHPLTDLYETMRSYGLVSGEERPKKRQRRAEKAEEAEAPPAETQHPVEQG